MVECPIECVKSGCDDPPDFLTKHSGFLLTIVASASAMLGMLISYLLKSRCTNIKCLGLACQRDVIDLKASDVEIVPS